MDGRRTVPREGPGNRIRLTGLLVRPARSDSKEHMSYEPRRGEAVGREWSALDSGAAQRIWNAMSADRQQLFAPLIQQPDQYFTADELGRTFAPPRQPKAVTALLVVPARLCQEEGLDYFWSCSYWNGGSGLYWLSPLVAALLSAAGEPRPFERPLPPDVIPRFEGDVSWRGEVERRREQSDLRRRLLRGTETERCSLCRAPFPVKFLHAAHIKPRSACTDDERRDLAHIAMLLCTFGCDALYEAGWVAVAEDGTIVAAVREGAGAVAERLAQLGGRMCVRHDARTARYFRWHRENVFDRSPLLARRDASGGAAHHHQDDCSGR